MKTRFQLLLFIGLLHTFNALYAQSSFAKTEMSYNINANSLSLELNTTKDTLLLKSERIITHIYSINSKYKREIDLYLDTQNFSLPLVNLSKGKHLLIVGESQKKIVFVIRILKTEDTISLKKTKLSYIDN